MIDIYEIKEGDAIKTRGGIILSYREFSMVRYLYFPEGSSVRGNDHPFDIIEVIKPELKIITTERV